AAAEIVIETKQQLIQRVAGQEETLRERVRYALLRRRQRLTEAASHRGFTTLQTLLAQCSQRSDELTGRLIEAGRESLRQARRRWEMPHTFLLHLDLRGQQERRRLRWNRVTSLLGQQARLLLISRRGKLDLLRAQLEQLNPQRVMERGYAIAFDSSGAVLKDAKQVSPDAEITLRLARGTLGAQVKKINPE
ncbi:MAG: hypothetical protein O7E51_17390, partial [Acidobacteria bacterium]|nr:hypothetical protein [Acidobacteriota bacterium]